MIVVGVLAAPESSAVAEVARRAASIGSKVEVVGVVPGDAAWDRVLFELTAAGVGHATVVRSERGSIEPADLELALRYLPDVRAVVLMEPPAGLVSTASAGADFAGATLVVVGPLDAGSIAALEALGPSSAASRSADEPPGSGAPLGSGTPPGSGAPSNSGAPIVLDPPATDPDGTFAGFVAALAARLDAGDPPEAAFKATVSALAVDHV
ncbi:MAG TPA: hypothetical protein VFP56_10890 [Candidatus Limnocylindrales bacterium]|nr:hypothetical protein [Candidatus Limnocylindrales bacterium]